MRLSELTAGLEDSLTGDLACPVELTDLTDDSRLVKPGSLFVARAGATTHGGAFIAEALARGASAILTDTATATPENVPTVRAGEVALVAAMMAERFFGCPSQKLKLIGVTGTNGKTTTVHLIQQILTLLGVRCGLMGTVLVDDGADRRAASLTTPGAIEISRTLARMVANGCAAGAMEASSHALAQGRCAALDFDAAVFTNLTGDHLDYHGRMESYAGAKARLFESLGSGATAIVNRDAAQWERMVAGCRGRVVRCSLDRAAEAEALLSASRRSNQGADVSLDVSLVGPWGEVAGVFRLLGKYNLMNLLEALAAAHAIGVDVGSIGDRLVELRPPPGRLEPVALESGSPAPTILVDYAHTDDALASALRAVRPIVPAGGRLWVVFGCGGDRDAAKRPRMGATAAGLADVVVVTSDNPRTEDPHTIIDEIVAEIPRALRDGVVIEPSRACAIARAVEEAWAGDVVLIAGKGHEDYQIIFDGAGGTVRRPFDDRVEARRALRRRVNMGSSARSLT